MSIKSLRDFNCDISSPHESCFDMYISIYYRRNASSKQQSRRQRDGERKLVTVNTKSDSGSSKEVRSY